MDDIFNVIGFTDYLLLPFYVAVIYKLADSYKKTLDPAINPYFIPALLLRLCSCVAFGMIHQYYYHGGDTFVYFYNAKMLGNSVLTNPLNNFSLLFQDYSVFHDTHPDAIDIASASTYMVTKLAMPCIWLGLNTYLPSSLIFTVVCFSGVWKMFTQLYAFFPTLKKPLALCFLFFPTVIFWTSCILKDPICLGGLGWVFYAFIQIVINRKATIKYWLIAIMALYIVFTVKAYIIIAFCPPFFLWLIKKYGDTIKDHRIKNLILPLIVLMSFVAAVVAIWFLMSQNERFNANNVLNTASDTNEYLRDSGGSAYNLVFEPTLEGLLGIIPTALNVSLFRPYLWEIKNVFMLLSALESLFVLYLTVSLVWKVGFFRIWKIIFSELFIVFLLIYAIVFLISVGITSGNFGTLVRYKLPGIPFYMLALYVVHFFYEQSQSTISSQGRKRKQVTTNNPKSDIQNL